MEDQKIVGSAPFRFNGEDLKKTVDVFKWSFSSLVVSLAIGVLGSIQFDQSTKAASAVAALIPVVNTLLYALGRWISDNRPQ